MSVYRINDIITPALPIAFAVAVLTSDNTNVADGDTVTIGAKVYTFKTTLTDGITANEVLIGASADASLTNLIAAINGTGTPGTDYGSATVANTQVKSGTVSSHAFTITAINGGVAANDIATTETSAHLSWDEATMHGGSGGACTALKLDKAATYTSEPFDMGPYNEAIAFLNAKSHAGTNPTLDVKFQVSHDQATWMDLGDAFTQVTTTDSLTMKRLTANFGKWMRAVITLGGTTPQYVFDLAIVAKG